MKGDLRRTVWLRHVQLASCGGNSPHMHLITLWRRAAAEPGPTASLLEQSAAAIMSLEATITHEPTIETSFVWNN